ncbi:MAG: hypothetical protein H6678_11565 [Candidatus Delongbacteria bacterium]|nr:hypothetical protein [Candidatus Delongbacteria bacterium]
MIDCQTCRQNLAELDSGQLEEELAVKVRLHLDGCEFCRSWRKRTANEHHHSAGPANGKKQHLGLDPIAMWYERFEKPRETRISRRRLRLIQAVIVLAAFSMMLLGVQMRSERMNRMISRSDAPTESQNPAALLTRALELDPPAAELFFPLWHGYRQKVDELAQLNALTLGQLEDVSRDASPHNQMIQVLNVRLDSIQSARTGLRSDFLASVGQRLGPEREHLLRSRTELWDLDL